MLPYMVIVLYLVASVGVGYLGRNTFAGAFGTFLLSILLTPLVILIALVAFSGRRRVQ